MRNDRGDRCEGARDGGAASVAKSGYRLSRFGSPFTQRLSRLCETRVTTTLRTCDRATGTAVAMRANEPPASPLRNRVVYPGAVT